MQSFEQLKKCSWSWSCNFTGPTTHAWYCQSL